jgi:predicted Zn-dependent protease
VANSNGVFGHQEVTSLDYTCTVRTEDGRGSGWVKRSARDAGKFDAREAADVAIEKALRSVEAKALEPGRYTVILEPAATSDLLSYMFFGFDARRADEGRSFLSKKGGANRLGDKLFDEQVNIWSDPWNQDVAVTPWDDGSMLARERQDIIKNGKVASLGYSQYWARKKGVRPIGLPGNFIMAGTDKSTAELIANTKKGVLVTRTWYIRMVDPQSVLLTGLTRDGTFYIENGKIKHPIKNFRFNESPVAMLNNIEEIGKPVVIGGEESPFSMLLPPMKVRDFNFTSLSDAV